MDQFQKEKIFEPRIQDFMKKVTLESDPGFNQKYPGTLAAEMEIRTKDGKRFTGESIYPKGHPQNPMTDEEIKDKFRRLSLNTLDRVQTEKIIEKVYELEWVNRADELIQRLVK
jgi:2-methylcitrate dehydratase